MKPTPAAAPTATATSTDKVLESKWGKAQIESGYTAVPTVLLHAQQALKLKPLDVLIILHLASYWWKPADMPWPAKGTIAGAVGVDARTVQRSIKKMEDMGYIKRIERRARAGDNLSNQYDLSGLVKALKPLASEALKVRKDRAEEDSARRATPKALALVQGGKKP